MNSLFRKTGHYLKNQQLVNIYVNGTLFEIPSSNIKVKNN